MKMPPPLKSPPSPKLPLAAIVAGLMLLALALGHRVGGRETGGDGETAMPSPAAGFGAVHVYVDSGDKPLAAYQVEIKAEAGDVALYGIEGGEHPAFKPPPRYDPQALLRQRVVIAAFDTGSDLPAGKTRVATLMVRTAGGEQPRYVAELQAAASADGKAIPATVTLSQPQGTQVPQGADVPQGAERPEGPEGVER